MRQSSAGGEGLRRLKNEGWSGVECSGSGSRRGGACVLVSAAGGVAAAVCLSVCCGPRVLLGSAVCPCIGSTNLLELAPLFACSARPSILVASRAQCTTSVDVPVRRQRRGPLAVTAATCCVSKSRGGPWQRVTAIKLRGPTALETWTAARDSAYTSPVHDVGLTNVAPLLPCRPTKVDSQRTRGAKPARHSSAACTCMAVRGEPRPTRVSAAAHCAVCGPLCTSTQRDTATVPALRRRQPGTRGRANAALVTFSPAAVPAAEPGESALLHGPCCCCCCCCCCNPLCSTTRGASRWHRRFFFTTRRAAHVRAAASLSRSESCRAADWTAATVAGMATHRTDCSVTRLRLLVLLPVIRSSSSHRTLQSAGPSIPLCSLHPLCCGHITTGVRRPCLASRCSRHACCGCVQAVLLCAGAAAAPGTARRRLPVL